MLRDFARLVGIGKCVSFLKAHKIFVRMLHQSAKKHGFTVCVEGNIASGKTTFFEYFKKFSSLVEVHEEPVTEWRNLHGHNILAKMYEDPRRWALTFQSYVQMTMLDMHLKKQKCPIKMVERSIYSAKCFVENLHRNSLVLDLEYIVLSEWFDWILKSHNIKVDLMVYLQTRPDVVLQRIRDRNRAEEQRITLEYVQALHDLHEEWLIKKSKFYIPCQVLVLDANSDLPEMHKIYEERKSEILFGLGDT
ncbi:hypothetical protein CHS0354_014771 [Potamilus streckersoni]|uniref:Deoxynucleoside kinase domain-containing protein n=1 Tax=Potamilus streckersoni TaxID=2493646 RepID=A0AAE0VRV0_9BIVA|nr:hypothetical protein CHS0354_014771 [Potamilus streckersoni]